MSSSLTHITMHFYSGVLCLLGLSVISSNHAVLARGRHKENKSNTRKGRKNKSGSRGKSSLKGKSKDSSILPNIVVVMIDDLGFNQLGFRANPAGNDEIYTPSIDKHATEGIIMDRGYMTPWCGPSRAAIQTGTMAAFNENVTAGPWSFNGDIGFIGGIPPDKTTLPQALKEYAHTLGEDYATSYAGKWGIGGQAWTNTPMGAGYDNFRGFLAHSLEPCDGNFPLGAQGPTVGNADLMARSVPGYFEQSSTVESSQCEYFKSLSNDMMSMHEKDIACKTTSRVMPKILDDDILDFSKARIKGHDYSQKPLFHFHATQLIHTPQHYPAKYDKKENMPPKLQQMRPDYFDEGAEKPPATNTDMRLKIANMIRYMDDVFDGLMGAIKEVGQWDNTIVLFTSDNGGAIFPLNANNNFPLRGGKRAIFEGGYRVNQFLSGGWINANIHSKKQAFSDTFVFANDWAPTLLEMAGGTSDHIFGKAETGPMAGNAMWEYIKSSVDSSSGGSHQKERKVSYSPDVFYDVTEDATHKWMHTPEELPNFYNRKWEAVWPKNDDVIPDFGYISISPCRPGGVAQECCYFEVTGDPEEDNPIQLSAHQCKAKLVEAQDLYAQSITPSCDTYSAMGCGIEQNPNPTSLGKDQAKFALWTHYGAVMPFVNSKAQPIIPDNNKCTCQVMDEGITQADVDAYIPTFQTPTPCISLTKSLNFNASFAIPCSGGFQRLPETGDWISSFEGQGLNKADYQALHNLERNGKYGGVSRETTMTLYRIMYQYANRQSFTEWPAIAKFPYVTPAQSTCVEKGVTPVPIPTTDVTPWFLSSGDGGARFKSANMCQSWNDTHAWCPAISNPLQEGLKGFDKNGEWAMFTNGTKFTPINRESCDTLCAKKKENTPYIGEGKWGMTM